MTGAGISGADTMDQTTHRLSPRIARERQTVAAMIDIYCRAHHAADGGLCCQCEMLREYAFCRLDGCRFGVEKTPCAVCPVHCFSSIMRARIKEVMRYAGPRMLVRHPILALLHQWDNLKSQKGDRQ
jgi:hypothetical protein